MGSDIITTILVLLIGANLSTWLRSFALSRGMHIVLCSVLMFFLISLFAPTGSYALFEELTDKGIEIFTGMREIIYVVAGFGIIGIAVGGFFGNLNWKWLGAVIIGLVIIAVTAAFINYVAGEDVVAVQDTLK